MQNTKLISLFKTFSPVEFKEFDKFLSSPFHAGDRNLRPFFETLKDFYPDFDDPNLTSEETFRVLYPDEKFDESRIRKLSSFLFKMAEEYLIIVELRGKTIERKFMLLEQFRKGDSTHLITGSPIHWIRISQLKNSRWNSFM